ncbi:MAG: ABC transporter permease subunit, partial [Chthoniobacterales bacterium]
MKTLFWKEWRENFKWALLAAGCVVGAMLYTLRPNPQQFDNYRNIWQSLCSPSFLLITTFGFPVVGAALGFLQILTELRRDQWAFLVHRPVTRNEIFWGKCIPGMLLYILATIVPLFLIGWWVSLPGSIPAPFNWGLVIPGVMDAVTGLTFYFAALWIGIQPGRWYGRRALPLIAACWGAVQTQDYAFHNALESSLPVLIAIFFSCEGAFVSLGKFRRMPWYGKAGNVLTLLLVLSMLWTWQGSIQQMIFPQKRYTYTEYSILKDGTLVKVTNVSTNRTSSIEKVTTLDGREIPPQDKLRYEWRDFLFGGNLNLRDYEPYHPYRSASQFFSYFENNDNGPASWYYLPKDRHFIAYDRISNQISGYMGPNGFAPENRAS